MKIRRTSEAAGHKLHEPHFQMKHKLSILAIAFASAVSCVSTDTDVRKLCIKEFNGCQESGDGALTRTSLGAENEIIWTEDDHITVFADNSSSGTRFSDVSIFNDGRTAVFKGRIEMSDAYYAIYPADDDARFDPERKTVTMTIPTLQTATEESFADKTNAAIARTKDGNLFFRNIGALLAIRCPTAYASSIRLRSRDKDIMMSGKAVIGYEGNNPEVLEMTDGQNYLDLDGLGKSSIGKTFYLTAYPGDYNGFDIIITNWALTHKSIISSDKVLQLERNDNILLYNGDFIGWNAPMEPSSVIAGIEKDNTVTVNWTCSSDESICKGFRVLLRKSETAEKPEILAETSASERRLDLDMINDPGTYDIGVQSLGYAERYNSDIIWAMNVDVPKSGLYDWEASRTEIPEFADLDLITGGITAKTPNTWSEDRLKPHVTFIDENGTEHWLHEAFLYIGSEDAQANSILCITSDKIRSADQNSWKRFADYWISPSGVTETLDRTIGNAISRIGKPSFRHKVVITMPDPIMLEYFYDKNSSTTYWGKIDGRQLDFSNVEDQILAYRWYIDYVREAWNKSVPEHIELAGFYILSEILVAKPSGWNYKYKRWDKIIPETSEYLHQLNYGLYWIPYYQADGYDMTRQLGIDYTWLQPNKYWDYQEKKSWNWVFNSMSTYGHGMEIEFEGSHGEAGWSQFDAEIPRTSSSILETVRTSNDAQGTPKGQPNPQAARNRQRLRDYFNEFKEAGYYGKARIATYSGTDAMYELATSPDEKDREMYLEYCRFITCNPLRNNENK